MSVLAILDEGPTYGLRIKNEFESRTGGVWPLNVGQVYQTLSRLERDGLVGSADDDPGDNQKVYAITASGREVLREWFTRPAASAAPARDELVLKLVMAASHPGVKPDRVIQAERRAAVSLLQDYTKLKREAPREADIGWLFLLDSLIFQTEARVRWLDACEARLGRRRHSPRRTGEDAVAFLDDALALSETEARP
jgi:DNA-binding PadR family transcriptional regulator